MIIEAASRWFSSSPGFPLILGPLRVGEQVVSIQGRAGSARFDLDGIRWSTRPPGPEQFIPWGSVAEMSLDLPIEPRWAWIAIGTFNCLVPKGYVEHGSWQVQVEVIDPWENVEVLALGRPRGHFGRSVRNVLDEVLLVLGRNRALPALSSADFVRDLLEQLPADRPRGEKRCRGVAREATLAALDNWNVGIQNAEYRFPDWPLNNADRKNFLW